MRACSKRGSSICRVSWFGDSYGQCILGLVQDDVDGVRTPGGAELHCFLGVKFFFLRRLYFWIKGELEREAYEVGYVQYIG